MVTNGADTNTLLVTMWPTEIGTNYQIYSFSETNGPWIVETNFVGTNTSTTVAIYLNGRTLSLIGGDGGDPDGDGLPSGYEVLATHTDPLLPDTGLTGIEDGYKDPDGDGYVNLQEMYNGTDPLVFNAPPAASGFSVVANNDGTTTVSWNASSGYVTGYVVYRETNSEFVAIATNTASQTSYHDTSLPSGVNAYYEVQVLYTLGNSAFTAPDPNLYRSNYDAPTAIVNGPSNRLYLVVSSAPVSGGMKVVEGWRFEIPFSSVTFSSPTSL